jgi:hypothetical protein
MTTALPNHVVSLEEERRWYRQTKSVGGLEIDDEFKFRGLLHREVGGLDGVTSRNGLYSTLTKIILCSTSVCGHKQ